MSVPNRKSLTQACQRCGNPPPTWYDNMGPGVPAMWLCCECVHIKNVVYRFKVSTLAYEALYRKTYKCPVCSRPIAGHQKHADIDRQGRVRGIVCAKCQRILNAAKSDPGLLSKMIVYIGLPPRIEQFAMEETND